MILELLRGPVVPADHRWDRDNTACYPHLNIVFVNSAELANVSAYNEDAYADKVQRTLLRIVNRIVDGPISIQCNGTKVEDRRSAQKDVGRREQLAYRYAQQPSSI